jgi:DNA (cytosine-5)-methyltransferase 1
VDSRADAHMHDPRSILTVEPMRWATLLLPEWIALEQVPAVLPLWEHMARRLRAQHGYSVWTGLVYAERYGVPQTRQRAVLLASRAREVSEPVATHRRYYPPGHRYAESGNGDGHLPRWVSMAEALGWVEGLQVNTRAERKTPGGNNFSADRPSWGLTEKTRSWMVRTGNFSAVERDDDGSRSAAGSVPYERSIDSPSPTVTGASGRWMVQNARTNATVRHESQPAPTITGSHDFAERRWVAEIVRERKSGQHVAAHDDDWPGRRPATFVNGWGTIAAPGHKGSRGGSDPAPRQMDGAIRVSIEEAAMLQTFPPDYPFQGTRTKQFMQVGNAVPPRMAEALLRTVLGMGPRRFEDREPVDLEGD